MYCNACGTAMNGRYCHQCGRANPGWTSTRRPLERPRQGRKIAGVCLALANNLNADPNLIRVLWVVLSVMTAVVFGLIAYFVAWILIPEEPEVVVAANRQPSAS